MKERITERLREIEERYDVRILYAVESGSRAWGFDSPDSDYDVRFIYVHRRDWYLTLGQKRDVIEETDPDKVLDLSGWDIRKAFSLMSKGNCSFAEWIASPIVYYKDDEFLKELTALKDTFFRTITTVNHYYHTATNHDKRYLEKRGFELKRFLYHLRGLLASQWAIERGTYPPVPFSQLVDGTVKEERIRKEIEEMVTLKKAGSENNCTIVSQPLIDYTEQLNCRIRESLGSLPVGAPVDTTPLNRLLLDIINR
jgi:predicted nucleotidyltransferase